MASLDDRMRHDDAVATAYWPAHGAGSEATAAADDPAVEAAGATLRSLLTELRAETGASGEMPEQGSSAAIAPPFDTASHRLVEADREDALFQSADWDRASGRLDGTFDLDGE